MAAFVLDIASSLSRALGPAGPPLPFSIGPPAPASPSPAAAVPWVLHSGTRKDDQSPVAVFVFDIQRHRDRLPLAQNALHRAKTIRHPDALRFIDGCETETKIIIGTEFARPLSAVLEESRDVNLISFGLYKLASALKFLNVDCLLVHGNVCPDSIYVTPAGEWKLGGLGLLSALSENNSPLFNFPDITTRSKFSPPEVVKSGPAILRSLPIQALDAWGLAALVHEIFNGPNARMEDLNKTGAVPQTLAALCQRLRHPNPKSRLSFEQFLSLATSPGSYFDNDFVATSLFLEQMALKDAHEKDAYLQKVNTSVESFPVDFCKYKILPELIHALEFGGAGAKALSPILKIGGRLNDVDFDAILIPVITRLFASPDRAIRIVLCENLEHYIRHLSQKAVSEKIFPNLATGFSDTSAIVRESSLKSILILIPKLYDRIVNNDLLRILAKLQSDEEPGIRTNTTICIGKISRTMSDTVKKKVLVTAFLRSLTDTFSPARNAGLLAIAATLDQFDPREVAFRLIPGISPLLIDPEKSIRKQALKTIGLLIKKAESHSDTMPDTLAQAQIEGAALASPAADASHADGTWAGWAISAVSSRLGSSAVASKDPSKPITLETGLASPAVIRANAPTSRDATTAASNALPATTPLDCRASNTSSTVSSTSTSTGMNLKSNPWPVVPEIIPALPPPPQAPSSSAIKSFNTGSNATNFGDFSTNRFSVTSTPQVSAASTFAPAASAPKSEWGNDGWDFDDSAFESKLTLSTQQPASSMMTSPSPTQATVTNTVSTTAWASIAPTPPQASFAAVVAPTQSAFKPHAAKPVVAKPTTKSSGGPAMLIDQWDVWGDFPAKKTTT